EGAGFSVKKKGKYSKPAYAIVRGEVEGSVVAKVKAQGRHGSIQYCHAHSLDGGTTWIDHPPTTEATYAISGLPVEDLGPLPVPDAQEGRLRRLVPGAQDPDQLTARRRTRGEDGGAQGHELPLRPCRLPGLLHSIELPGWPRRRAPFFAKCPADHP